MSEQIEYSGNDAKCELACECWELIERIQGASDIQKIVVEGVLREKKDGKVIWVRDFLNL